MRYWKRLNPDETINTVESYSHNLDVEGAIEITKEEFDDYMASLPVPPEPEPIVFTPKNPALGIEQRLTNVEDFLQTLYPPT